MRLALLGNDDETLRLARALVAEGHELSAAFDVDDAATELRQVFPEVRIGEDWEAALLATTCDCAIVALGRADRSAETGISATERREDQLRKLAQAEMPALVVHPACEAIVGFEIEMIRRDCQGLLIPYLPGLLHPAFEELAKVVDDSAAGSTDAVGKLGIGTVEQIVFERYQADRSRAAVLLQFARDVALLRRLIGETRKLNATGPAGRMQADPLGPKPKGKLELTNLGVHLIGQRAFSARWTVVPEPNDERGIITILGSHGRAMLIMPVGTSRWTLTDSSGSARNFDDRAAEFSSWSRQLPAMVQGIVPPPLSWLDACRATEATAAIDRSLERGRTIELYNEEHTEVESFKGVMAVGGCLLLTLALAMLLVAAMVEGLQLPLRNSPLWRLWPLFLLAPIGIFLLLQLLQGVARRAEPGTNSATGKPPH